MPGRDHRVFVGSLSRDITKEALRSAFQDYGCTEVVLERYPDWTPKRGILSFPTAAKAAAAIEGKNGEKLGGRRLRVEQFREWRQHPRKRAREGAEEEERVVRRQQGPAKRRLQGREEEAARPSSAARRRACEGSSGKQPAAADAPRLQKFKLKPRNWADAQTAAGGSNSAAAPAPAAGNERSKHAPIVRQSQAAAPTQARASYRHWGRLELFGDSEFERQGSLDEQRPQQQRRRRWREDDAAAGGAATADGELKEVIVNVQRLAEQRRQQTQQPAAPPAQCPAEQREQQRAAAPARQQAVQPHLWRSLHKPPAQPLPAVHAAAELSGSQGPELNQAQAEDASDSQGACSNPPSSHTPPVPAASVHPASQFAQGTPPPPLRQLPSPLDETEVVSRPRLVPDPEQRRRKQQQQQEAQGSGAPAPAPAATALQAPNATPERGPLVGQQPAAAKRKPSSLKKTKMKGKLGEALRALKAKERRRRRLKRQEQEQEREQQRLQGLERQEEPEQQKEQQRKRQREQRRGRQWGVIHADPGSPGGGRAAPAMEAQPVEPVDPNWFEDSWAYLLGPGPQAAAAAPPARDGSGAPAAAAGVAVYAPPRERMAPAAGREAMRLRLQLRLRLPPPSQQQGLQHDVQAAAASQALGRQQEQQQRWGNGFAANEDAGSDEEVDIMGVDEPAAAEQEGPAAAAVGASQRAPAAAAQGGPVPGAAAAAAVAAPQVPAHHYYHPLNPLVDPLPRRPPQNVRYDVKTGWTADLRMRLAELAEDPAYLIPSSTKPDWERIGEELGCSGKSASTAYYKMTHEGEPGADAPWSDEEIELVEELIIRMLCRVEEQRGRGGVRTREVHPLAGQPDLQACVNAHPLLPLISPGYQEATRFSILVGRQLNIHNRRNDDSKKIIECVGRSGAEILWALNHRNPLVRFIMAEEEAQRQQGQGGRAGRAGERRAATAAEGWVSE